MSRTMMAALIVLASYAAANVAITAAIGFIWSVALRRWHCSQNTLLGLRLLPAVGSGFLALTVFLPAFLRFEPIHGPESPGLIIAGLALLSAFMIGAGVVRGIRAVLLTRSIAARWTALRRQQSPSGVTMDVVDVPTPIVAVSGLWRPRLLIGRDVATQCTTEELALIIAHEEAHVRFRDNFKQFLMLVTPDLLNSLGLGRELEERWRAATEHAADEYATQAGPEQRIRLASALVKMARLAVITARQPGVASTLIGADGIEGRIRRLLDRPSVPPSFNLFWLAPIALVATFFLALGEHQSIHAAIEQFVRWGR